MSNKIGVFVDLISLFGSVKVAYNGRKINYEEYLEKIKEHGTIYRANAYGAFIGEESASFITCLENIGYEPKYVKATIYEDKPNIKRTDRTMDIVVDIMKIMERIDTVVIGSLNLQLIPFINFLRERGIKVILFACNVKRELKIAANEYWLIDDSVLEIGYKEAEIV